MWFAPFRFSGLAPVSPDAYAWRFLNYSGSHAVVLLSVPDVLDKGMTCSGLRSSIQGLTPADAKRWLDDVGTKVQLAKGDALWMPPGYVPWVFGTSEGMNISAYIPLLSEGLFRKLTKDTLREVCDSFSKFLAEAKRKEPWTSTEKLLTPFLEKFD